MLCIGVAGAAGCLRLGCFMVDSGRRVHPTLAGPAAAQRRQSTVLVCVRSSSFPLGTVLLTLLFGAVKDCCIHDCIACTQEQTVLPQCVAGWRRAGMGVWCAVIVRGARYVTLGAEDIVPYVKWSVCCAKSVLFGAVGGVQRRRHYMLANGLDRPATQDPMNNSGKGYQNA